MFTVNNIVFGYEENFKQLSYMYENEDDRSMIADARNRVYKDIITLLCNEFQLEANLEVWIMMIYMFQHFSYSDY